MKNKYAGHTPGPWRIKDTITNLYHIVAGSKRICIMADLGHETQEDIANAKLIADAPMLARQNAIMFDIIKEYEARFDKPISLVTRMQGIITEMEAKS